MKAKPPRAVPASSSGRLRRLFQRSIEQRSTLAATAEEQGVAASVLWRAAHEAQYQPLDRALEALDSVGLPPAAFFSELAREEAAAAGAPPSPPVWLRFYRDKSPADAFFKQVEPALLELLARPPAAGAAAFATSCGGRAELRAIDELRPKDAAAARAALEAKILGWLEPAVLSAAAPSRGLSADLATAMCIRAAILRQRGQNGAASDELALAYELARRAGDSWVLGFWHQKAPWLLYDARRFDLALELLEPALRFYFAAGAFEEASQLFVDRAILYNELGRVAEAEAEYALALERLPPSSWRHRLAAHLNLAQIHQREGRLETALAELELAARESRERDLAYAFLRRRGGEILRALEKPALAIPLFEESLQLFTALGDGEDVVLVALQLTDALLRAGERRKAHALARDLAAALGRKRDDAFMKAARDAFDDLAALAELGRLTESEVAEVRSRIETGQASPRRMVRRATHS
jgi:tetratricopeptide (TPR) repeat protein